MPRPGLLSAAALLCATTALIAPSVRAEDVQPLTPEQTESLAHALDIYDTDQIAAVFGPGTNHVTPEGDHYLVKLPLSRGRDTTMLSGDDVTMHAKPLDDHRWSFDTVTLPAHIVVGAKDSTTPIDVTLATTGLTYNGTVDPTNASPGSSDYAIETMQAHVTQKAKSASDTDIDLSITGGAGEGHGTTTAAVDGLVDIASKFAFSNIGIVTAGTSPVKITLGKVLADLSMTGVSPEQSRAFSAAVDSFSKQAQATIAAPVPAPAPADGTTTSTPPKPALTEEQKAAVRTMITSARAMLKTVTIVEEADDLAIEGSDGTSIKMGKLRLATVGSAPDSKLDAREEITVDGLTVDAQGLGPAAPLIPHRFVFTPHIIGLPLDDVTSMIGQLIDHPDADGSAVQTAFTQMVAKGPIHVGIDQLAFDVGPATFDATAAVDVTDPSPAGNAITADVKATGLDDLMKMMSADPTLRQGVAAIVFVKGVGKQDGNTVTWHVVFKDGHLLVNGTDMSQMVPH